MICPRVQVTSTRIDLGHRIFSVVSEPHVSSHRAVYVSDDADNPMYLYHTLADPIEYGIGRWVFYHQPGSSSMAHAYVDSWAVGPHLVGAVNDPEKSSWMVHVGDSWQVDEGFDVQCAPSDSTLTFAPAEDTTVYLEVHGFPWHISGFYVQISESDDMPVYSHVHSDDDIQLYLYRIEDMWLIGEEVGSDRAIAYVVDSANTPGRITHSEWYYSRGEMWETRPTIIVRGTRKKSIYERLNQYRSIPYLPPDQTYHRLRHNIPMPSIGLGTGNIPLDSMNSTLTTALRLGYRMFDMAREYKNEAIMGEILSRSGDGIIPERHEVFLVSKVWPTELGFATTNIAISQSLRDMSTAYLDMYMLHWPWCVAEWPWMHCETTVDPSGTWVQSYKSLERAYAEGRVASIGVSNFNFGLLESVRAVADVFPHAVQNHATLMNLDMDVRQWCSDYGAAYIPYSSVRGIQFLPTDTQKALANAVNVHNASHHAVVMRFFLQTGAVVIPRTTNPDHLKENIELLKTFALTEDEMGEIGWPYTPWHAAT